MGCESSKSGRPGFAVSSDEGLITALKLAKVAYFEFDTATYRYTFNDFFYTLLGTTAEAEGGYEMSLDDFMARFIPSDERPLLRRRIDYLAGVSGEEQPLRELRIIRKDGQICFVYTQSECVKDSSGRVVRIKGTIQDVTERKKSEEALRERGERFRNCIEYSSDLLMVVDSNGIVTYVGPSVERLLGYKPEEIEGTEGYWLMHPEDREPSMEAVSKMDRRLGIANPPIEIRYRHKGGSWRCFEVIGTLFQDSSFMQYMVINARDITERKLAEEENRSVRDRLSEAMDLAGLVDFELDMVKREYIFNDSFYAFLGTTAEAEGGYRMSIEDYLARFVPPEEVARILDRQKRIDDGFSMEGEPNESLVIRRDGTVCYVIVAVGRVDRNSEGHVVARHATMLDITERKKAEIALAKRTEDLARSNKELEQFAYIVSHDLQEPLRMISSYTKLLEKRYCGHADEDVGQFMNFIIDGAGRMKQLIDDLLAYSRVGTGNKVLKPTSSQVALDTALMNLKMIIQESDAVVTADSVQLGQLFQNLVGNAVKFRGEEAPRVHISAEGRDHGWVFAVRDNGIGIDPKHFDRIFMVFQRLHAKGRYEGTAA